MTNTKTEKQITAELHARFTQPEAMRAYLDSQESVHCLAMACGRALSVAKEPRSRFGVTESNPEVVAVVKQYMARVSAEVVALALAFEAMEDQGMARDEIWTRLQCPADALGFGYGDSELLKACAAW